jgi:hypothetical protein
MGSSDQRNDRFPAGTDPGLLEYYAVKMGKSDVDVLCESYRMLRTASAAPYLSHI